ncbi:3-phosphoshikimate 1-carboxyvinyltransferase [Bacteroidia bacterium]|nr:3-phosphoshikimate 1-carboxyvinyltransferase [Bacteroidia bacterium]
MTTEITPRAVAGMVAAPASKSYAQRAIAAALLARGGSTLRGVDPSGDTLAALGVARALGAMIESHGDICHISGGLDPKTDTIDIGESGLSTRLFTPIAALCNRRITVAGHGSILTRPVSMMEAPLRELGVEVRSDNGHLPISVRGPMSGGVVHADGEVSSQFITGLLMAAPLAAEDTFICVASLNSRPYIDMTLEVMRRFGVEADNRNYAEFHVRGGQSYAPTDYRVEGDWSGASTLLVAGATRGSVTVANLNPSSAQADAAMLEALRRAGARVEVAGMEVTVSRGELRGFEFDATQCPDLFPALAALGASCRGETILRGTRRLTHKESDRAATLAGELGRLGVAVDIRQPDVMRITGGAMRGAAVSSHNDHRIAMALAVAALGADGPTTIEGAEAVGKSYPDFWRALRQITPQ